MFHAAYQSCHCKVRARPATEHTCGLALGAPTSGQPGDALGALRVVVEVKQSAPGDCRKFA
jgi:hypothetical protein